MTVPQYIEDIGWIVYGKTKKRKARAALYYCNYCGEIFISRVDNITSGNTKSCGCLQTLNPNRTTHGMSYTPMYSSWYHMKYRCSNVNHHAWHRYGGRGITVDSTWNTFEVFYEDMKDSWFDGASIDRIDNNGNYNKSNCQWLSIADNSRKRDK